MARGGLAKMKVSFRGRKESLEKIFGTGPIPVTQMTKKLWGFIKRNKLMKKK